MGVICILKYVVLISYYCYLLKSNLLLFYASSGTTWAQPTFRELIPE